MQNPIIQELNGSRQIPENDFPYKQNIEMLKNSKNPMSMMNLLAFQNPQLKNVMNFVRSSGSSPKDVFYAMAKQKGINPDDIINMLR